MIKAIIFDCYGVLTEDGWLPLKRKYVGENIQLANAIAELGRQNDFGTLDNVTHLEQVAELMGMDKEELRMALNRRVPNEELFAYIKTELKPHYKIGLLSNARSNVLIELFTLNQASVFDASVMSFESRLIKPDEAMYRLMAERLGVTVNECIYIDDVERYCKAAQQIGMKEVLYTGTEQCKAELQKLLV